jgi:hypothetical protein
MVVVVAQHWPASLILILALGLPLHLGYFPTKLHRYFNTPTKQGVMAWQSTREFCAPFADNSFVYLLSGVSGFLQWLLPLFGDHQRVIVTVEFPRRAASCSMIQRAALAGQEIFRELDLQVVIVADSAVGGTTDGRHIFGIGCNIVVTNSIMIEQGLPRVLCHYLDGGVDGRFPTVLKDSLPVIPNPTRTVLLHNGIMHNEGLFPCCFPDILVYSPSYKRRDHWVVCGLTLTERLWLHQLPLSMDPLLAGLNSGGALPFEDAPSPEIYTSIFCQLWGAYGGGLEGVNDNADRTTLERDEEDQAMEDGVTEETMEDGVTEETGTETGNGDMVEELAAAPSALLLRDINESVMALQSVTAGPDKSSTLTRDDWKGNVLEVDFVPGRDDGTRLTDIDTVTSCASEEMLCRFPGARHGNGMMIEEHELGPSLVESPGHPFKVGDVILCNIPGQFWGMDP